VPNRRQPGVSTPNFNKTSITQLLIICKYHNSIQKKTIPSSPCRIIDIPFWCGLGPQLISKCKRLQANLLYVVMKVVRNSEHVLSGILWKPLSPSILRNTLSTAVGIKHDEQIEEVPSRRTALFGLVRSTHELDLNF